MRLKFITFDSQIFFSVSKMLSVLVIFRMTWQAADYGANMLIVLQYRVVKGMNV